MPKGKGRGRSKNTPGQPSPHSGVAILQPIGASQETNDIGRGRGRGSRESTSCQQPPQLSVTAKLQSNAPAKVEAVKEDIDDDSMMYVRNFAEKVSISSATSDYITDDSRSVSSNSDSDYSGETCSKLTRALRPGYSKAGKKQIKLITNFYLMKCTRKSVYHYDVDIVDKRPFKQQKPPGNELSRKIIVELLKVQQHLGKFLPVYDGKKNMFSAEPLPIGTGKDFDVYLPGNAKDMGFLVSIKPVRKKKSSSHDNVISLQPLQDYVFGKSTKVPNEVRLVLEAVLSYRPPDFNQINIRNSFFSMSANNRHPLGDGIELWQGYNQSVRFTEKGVALVVNMAHSAFYQSGPAIKFLGDVLRIKVSGSTELRSNEVKTFLRKMKSLQVEVTHQRYKRKYRVQGLGQSARQAKIEENGMTVEKYFWERYKLALKYPLLPCLHMAGGKGNVLLPIEVCSIVSGQRVPLKQLDGKKTAQIIRQAAIPPVDRFRKIHQDAAEINRISGDYLQNFNIGITPVPLSCTGRVLEQPKISYFKNAVANPSDKGTWNISGHFYSCTKVDCKLISARNGCHPNQLKAFAQLMSTSGRKYGLDLNFSEILPVSERDDMDAIFRKSHDQNVRMLVFILSYNAPYSYEEIKFLGDLKYGIPTQCVLSELIQNDRKFNDQVASNICLKINTKMGGVNHCLSAWPMALHREKVIIFGSDVVHNIDPFCPSIAAVVGTIDYGMSKYAVSCRAQSNPKNSGHSQEIIISLKEMVQKILREYYKSTGLKPEKILFYRDGVSEGQFQHVLDHEVPIIKDACQSLQKDPYQPPITFVVVQKRHQVRLRPENPRDGVGRHGNIPPGTTVDTVIVDPKNYDFYLCSHEGIQGTSKPAHYTVLFDENGVEPNIMESLTYFLCHVFARCNRSISIPAPVKYADLLAYRANAYVKFKYDKNRRVDQFPSEAVLNDIKRLVMSIDNIKNKMFFI